MRWTALLLSTAVLVSVTPAQKERGTLSGVVVDEQGSPIRGVSIHAEWKRRRKLAAAISRADGKFTIRQVGYPPPKVWLRVTDPAGYEAPPPTANYRWGTDDIKIVLRPTVSTNLEVVEDATGKPIEHYRAIWRAEKHASGLMHEIVRDGRHPKGAAGLQELWRGESTLKIVPKDPRLHVTVVPTRVRDGMPRMVVRVKRLFPKKLLVLDASGKPTGKVRIEVVDLGTMRYPGNDEWMNRERAGWALTCPRAGERYPSLVFEATTDAAGQCVVYGIPDMDNQELRVHRPDRETVTIEGVRFNAEHLSRRITVQ